MPYKDPARQRAANRKNALAAYHKNKHKPAERLRRIRRDRARRARRAELAFRFRRPPPDDFTRAGLHVVGAGSMKHDRTRWRGPGWRRELELQHQADQFLKAHHAGGLR
jgi:hypothetical protein